MKAKRNAEAEAARFVVIMAGGRGERFWPLSRENQPKQFLTLLGGRSLLQQAVDRVAGIVPPANIFVITNAAHVAVTRRQLPELPKANIVGEPCGRDTCAAVTLGAALVGARSVTGVMAVLPADHLIPDTRGFQRVLKDAFELAARGQVIVTIGIKPTEPATGYGYIEMGDPLPPARGAKATRTVFHVAKRFVEKPDLARAIEYQNSGRHRWNAGMFVWSFATLTEGLARHQPEFAAACEHWFQAAGTPRLAKLLAADYPDIKRISVDYALLERAHNVVVAEGDFAWDDLGAWPALARHLKHDPEGNAAEADFVHVDAARNLIFDARTKQRGLVAAVGLTDSVLVLTDDATLVAPKSQAQNLKALVTKLRKADREAVL